MALLKGNAKRYEDRKIPFFLVLLYLSLTVYAFVFSDRGYLNYRKLQQTEKKLTREISALESRKLFMVQWIDALSKNNYLYESIARNKLEMVKPDETVFQIEYADTAD